MVGSHLAEYLLKTEDWDIYGLSRWRSPTDNLEELTERINAGDRVYLHHADLKDTASINTAIKSIKPDFVFHLVTKLS